MVEGRPPAINISIGCESWSVPPLAPCHVRTWSHALAWRCLSLHDTSIDVWLVYGQGGADQSSGTSRSPPRCTVARQGTEKRRKSVVGPAHRPPRPNTHGDVKGRMPRRLRHSPLPSRYTALSLKRSAREGQRVGKPAADDLASGTNARSSAGPRQPHARPASRMLMAGAGGVAALQIGRAREGTPEGSQLVSTSHRSTPRV